MLTPTSFLSATEPMPFVLQMAFFLAGIVFLPIGGFRASASRRAWKRSQPEGRPKRYKMPVGLQIESNLYLLGVFICWAVSFGEWWLRAFNAFFALATVFALLYRTNLKTLDATPYDPESTLRLSNGNVSGD